MSILNLYFADDTLLFLKADNSNIEALKWILIGFENLSGMKINFSKYEMVSLNISSTETISLASLIGCEVSSLPITYLGIPLHSKKLRSQD